MSATSTPNPLVQAINITECLSNLLYLMRLDVENPDAMRIHVDFANEQLAHLGEVLMSAAGAEV